MATIEQLQIHSRDYLVRSVQVDAGHTISWSVQPHKKSINFGIFKFTKSTGNSTPSLGPPPTPVLEPAGLKRPTTSRNDSTTAPEQLRAKGLISVAWHGKCEADKVSMGKYDVLANQGGMYALVFDNTFSKQISKTATFVLLTYPTHAPPQSTHHLHHLQHGAGASTTSLGSKASPSLPPADSTDSLPIRGGGSQSRLPHLSSEDDPHYAIGTGFHTGVLQKRRRKRHQGFARRFFSLDFTSSTLSYYHSRDSSALRGAIPLSLAAVGTNDMHREIWVDSGAEVWHLKASSQKDFEGWKSALERASKATVPVGGISPAAAVAAASGTAGMTLKTSGLLSTEVNVAEEREWAQVEALVSRISGTRDAVRRLAKDTDPRKISQVPGLGILGNGCSTPTDSASGDSFLPKERRLFWKRKTSGSASSAVFQRSVSAQLAVPSPTSVPSLNGEDIPSHHEHGMYHHCAALLKDLDSVVADFSALIAESKRRRMPIPTSAISRKSIDSTSTGEFYDAEAGEDDSQLLVAYRDSSDENENAPTEDEFVTDTEDTASSSEVDVGHYPGPSRFEAASLFPPKPKSLAPLPLSHVRRRATIPAPTVLPPSLIGFMRKNVGKDLSTVSMPVSANEPTSLLQRISEQLEYSQLLDSAAAAPEDLRLAYITAFAISTFANARVKERAIRKPFNPMLGETFEIVREDRGFRFLAEKVSHRPVRMACQAESALWTLTQAPLPTQKFWGKSVELITDGRVRVVLHDSSARFSWCPANAFLRNILAGEKYVEPVGSMTISDESSGAKSLVTFKAAGLFSGRSEEVDARFFGPDGDERPYTLVGKWTAGLTLHPEGKDIWRAGPLIESPSKRYGLTSFAAELNEITTVEKGWLPPTDSRLRPDQRAAEQLDLERAEMLKARLEEGQRERRKAMEDQGVEWTPKWFVKGEGGGEGGEEAWRLRGGKDGYWERRVRKAWDGVVDVFQT